MCIAVVLTVSWSTDAEHAADAAAQEVAAGRGGAPAQRGRHVARGGLHAGLGAPRGGAPHPRRERETESEPSALSGQSASQGTSPLHAFYDKYKEVVLVVG